MSDMRQQQNANTVFEVEIEISQARPAWVQATPLYRTFVHFKQCSSLPKKELNIWRTYLVAQVTEFQLRHK